MISQFGICMGSAPRKAKRAGKSAGVCNVKEAFVLRKPLGGIPIDKCSLIFRPDPKGVSTWPVSATLL